MNKVLIIIILISLVMFVGCSADQEVSTEPSQENQTQEVYDDGLDTALAELEELERLENISD